MASTDESPLPAETTESGAAISTENVDGRAGAQQDVGASDGTTGASLTAGPADVVVVLAHVGVLPIEPMLLADWADEGEAALLGDSAIQVGSSRPADSAAAVDSVLGAQTRQMRPSVSVVCDEIGELIAAAAADWLRTLRAHHPTSVRPAALSAAELMVYQFQD